jgi:hypothetical protein
MLYKDLTEADILTIRAEYTGRDKSPRNTSVIELANRFGISQETVRKIAKGKVYAWVK